MTAISSAIYAGFTLLLLVLFLRWRPLKTWRSASGWFPWIIAGYYLAHRIVLDEADETISIKILESAVWLILFVALLYAVRNAANTLLTRPRWQVVAIVAMSGVVLLIRHI